MEAPCWSQFEEILEADLSITRFTSPEPGHPYRPYNGLDGRREDGKIPGRSGLGGREILVRRYKRSFTIFEGTSEIQHLVIARAISGMHIN